LRNAIYTKFLITFSLILIVLWNLGTIAC